MSENYFDSYHEYRADHITLDELEHVSAQTIFYNNVLSKLMSRGAKVIVGPRGVGKTHHMRLAYRKCLKEKKAYLPIYITFSKYLRLEPLKNTTSLALNYFHAWVLCKILLGTRDVLNDLKLDVLDFHVFENYGWNEIELYCSQIEKQQVRDWHSSLLDSLSIAVVSDFIEYCLNKTNRGHAIVFCDDAALVLTKEYMVEFFDIFRSIKSSKISPKASIYPNTEFGPRFHVGHDAEPVQCWPRITGEEYEKLFQEIYNKRFSEFNIKENVKKCLMYAAFGVPRTFINLINRYNISTKSSEQAKINEVISEQAELIINEYLSLAVKQPQYVAYVHAGKNIIESICQVISNANKEALARKEIQLFIGIQREFRGEKRDIQKNSLVIKRLLEETGLLQEVEPVRHGTNTDGSKRDYDRYVPHFTLLLSQGAFQLGRSGYINHFSEYISYPKVKHPIRKNSFSELIDDNTLSDLSLDLPNCSSCGKPRASEEQMFCMYCGSELVNKSIYNQLIKTKIDILPLTKWQKERILQETNIETIGDIILNNNPGQELMKVKWIGKIRAEKVICEVKNWMDEYLS